MTKSSDLQEARITAGFLCFYPACMNVAAFIPASTRRRYPLRSCVMRYALKTLFVLSTGLWLGGMLMSLTILFVFFAKDRNLAVQVGPTLITTFERFQMVAALISIVALVGWRLMACSKPKRILMPLVLIAIIGATISMAVISPKVNHLWFTGQGGTPEFWKWHGISQMIYMTQALCLFVAICLTPWAIDSEK